MKLFVMYFFSLHIVILCRPCFVQISDECTCKAQMKSGEGLPNVVASFWLNIAYMLIRTPNSCCTDDSYFFALFLEFRATSEEYFKVIIVHLKVCTTESA